MRRCDAICGRSEVQADYWGDKDGWEFCRKGPLVRSLWGEVPPSPRTQFQHCVFGSERSRGPEVQKRIFSFLETAGGVEECVSVPILIDRQSCGIASRHKTNIDNIGISC